MYEEKAKWWFPGLWGGENGGSLFNGDRVSDLQYTSISFLKTSLLGEIILKIVPLILTKKKSNVFDPNPRCTVFREKNQVNGEKV